MLDSIYKKVLTDRQPLTKKDVHYLRSTMNNASIKIVILENALKQSKMRQSKLRLV